MGSGVIGPNGVDLSGEKMKEDNQEESLSEEPRPSMDRQQEKSTWARLIKKVYGIGPLVCSKCGSKMKIICEVINYV